MKSDHAWTAIALTVSGVLSQFMWLSFPVEHQADVSNASRALLTLFALGVIANAYRGRLVWTACVLVGAWQGMIAGCSIWWIAAPWVKVPGQGQCSTAMELPLGLFGAWIACLVVASMWTRRHAA